MRRPTKCCSSRRRRSSAPGCALTIRRHRSSGSAFTGKHPDGRASRGRSRSTKRFALAGSMGCGRASMRRATRFGLRAAADESLERGEHRTLRGADARRPDEARGAGRVAQGSEAKSRQAAYEKCEDVHFSAEEERRFRAEVEAWKFFEAQAPWYRRLAIWRIISAKRPETREQRMAKLILGSAAERRI